ncbi:MAG: signal recognition particle protein [Mycoplasmataceae bacterium]|nr:signal recognition particle protein [Mycoplasmataceae bacterium]
MLKSMISSIVAKHFKKKLDNLTIKEEDINELLNQIKISLLDADVNVNVVKTFLQNIKTNVVNKTLSQGQDPQQYVLSVIKEELIEILGSNPKVINTEKPLLKIMLVGLQGSGKTTTCAKLAYYFQKYFKKNPLLVAIDVYRPAAIEQLKTLASEIKVDFFDKGAQNPVLTADESIKIAKIQENDVIIYDTAGRLQTNEKLMNELVEIRNKVNPDEILFVADAMNGQEIVNVASEFNKHLDLTGFIITKLDGDARAGAALSLTNLLNIPVIFSGTGEKIGSLEQFYPDRIANRILGLGDVASLAEKANDVVEKDKMKKSFTRMLAGKMDLEDLIIQTQQLNKVGDISSISKMIPGSGKISDDQIQQAENKIKVWTILINSMTKKERRNPALFKKESSRKTRVIKGSGRSAEEFNRLIKEWEMAKDKMAEIGKKIMKGQNPLNGLF